MTAPKFRPSWNVDKPPKFVAVRFKAVTRKGSKTIEKVMPTCRSADIPLAGEEHADIIFEVMNAAINEITRRIERYEEQVERQRQTLPATLPVPPPTPRPLRTALQARGDVTPGPTLPQPSPTQSGPPALTTSSAGEGVVGAAEADEAAAFLASLDPEAARGRVTR